MIVNVVVYDVETRLIQSIGTLQMDTLDRQPMPEGCNHTVVPELPHPGDVPLMYVKQDGTLGYRPYSEVDLVGKTLINVPASAIIYIKHSDDKNPLYLGEGFDPEGDSVDLDLSPGYYDITVVCPPMQDKKLGMIV